MSASVLTPLLHNTPHCIESVRSRILYKMRDYATYRFTAPQACAINIFFDLAQEFDDTEHVYLLSVLILRMFFQHEAELYLNNESGNPVLVTPAINHSGAVPLTEIRSTLWYDDSHCYVPVYGKNAFVVIRSERHPTNEAPIGVLVLHISRSLESHELLFLEKFANRVGFCLDNKRMAQRNERHVLFLRKLANDIGHNIITPNMRLKLMLRHLEGQIESFDLLIKESVQEAVLEEKLSNLQQKMAEQSKSIIGTFQNSALFLESLLRQSHFDLGRYVLRRVKLDLCALVVRPQFERYRPLFDEKNIHIANDQPFCQARQCMVQADLGLISQVLANMLSNAAKYSKPVKDAEQAEVRCSVELLPDIFGPNSPGVKVAVFSSGVHLPEDEAKRLFDDNYRASNASGQYGTGHGLFFVREIIAEHEGRSGYEPSEAGNTFYFILPVTT